MAGYLKGLFQLLFLLLAYAWPGLVLVILPRLPHIATDEGPKRPFSGAFLESLLEQVTFFWGAWAVTLTGLIILYLTFKKPKSKGLS